MFIFISVCHESYNRSPTKINWDNNLNICWNKIRILRSSKIGAVKNDCSFCSDFGPIIHIFWKKATYHRLQVPSSESFFFVALKARQSILFMWNMQFVIADKWIKITGPFVINIFGHIKATQCVLVMWNHRTACWVTMISLLFYEYVLNGGRRVQYQAATMNAYYTSQQGFCGLRTRRPKRNECCMCVCVCVCVCSAQHQRS